MLCIAILRCSISRPFSARFTINNATTSAAPVGHGHQLLGHGPQRAPAQLRHWFRCSQGTKSCSLHLYTKSSIRTYLFHACAQRWWRVRSVVSCPDQVILPLVLTWRRRQDQIIFTPKRLPLVGQEQMHVADLVLPRAIHWPRNDMASSPNCWRISHIWSSPFLPSHQKSDHAKASLIQNTATQSQTPPLALHLGVSIFPLQHVIPFMTFFLCRSRRGTHRMQFARPLSVTLAVTSSPSLPISTKLGEEDKQPDTSYRTHLCLVLNYKPNP